MGCGSHPKLVLSAARNKLSAVDRTHLLVEKEVTDRKGEKLKIKVLSPPLWSVTLPHNAGAGLVVAGDRVIAGGRDKVSLIDVGRREVVWTADVEGTAYGLAVADGRLYVSTDRAVIHCFGEAVRDGQNT